MEINDIKSDEKITIKRQTLENNNLQLRQNHDHSDTHRVEYLCIQLESNGIPCWYRLHSYEMEDEI